MLIDTHTHLTDERLRDIIPEVLDKMSEAGVGAIVNCGYDRQSCIESVDLADKHKEIYAAVGIHPENFEDYGDDIEEFLTTLAKNEKVVAIGEIGLEYHYECAPHDMQKQMMERQMEIAVKLGLPVILHVRDAYGDAFEILKNAKRLPTRILLHCYGGSAEMVREFSRFDCYFAFGGVVTFAKNKAPVVSAVPRDRLLLETDCPYMTPVPHRGETNMPAYVSLVCEKIADILGESVEYVADKTTENAKRFFGIN